MAIISFRRLPLPAFLPPVMQSVASWSCGRLSLSPWQSISCRFLSTDASASKSVEISESIRIQSQLEMEKVSKLFQSQQTPATLLIQSREDLTAYLTSHNIQNYLFDCDGVLYRGSDVMPGASKTILTLLRNGKRVFFVTNNAASSRYELKNKLEKILMLPMGTLEEEMMIGSAYVAAQYLRLRLKSNDCQPKKVHVIGTAGLCREIQSAGFTVTGGPDPNDTPSGMSRDELAAYPFTEGDIDAMVIGLDNDFNYRKLCIATVLLQRNPQALLVSTNQDAFDLVGHDARHLPGNGALVSSVEAASLRSAINVGKPSPILAKWLLEEFSMNPKETIMVGDRLDTDVKFGNCNGMKSALVLTGCATTKEFKELMPNDEGGSNDAFLFEMIPSIIFPHVGYMV